MLISMRTGRLRFHEPDALFKEGEALQTLKKILAYAMKLA